VKERREWRLLKAESNVSPSGLMHAKAVRAPVQDAYGIGNALGPLMGWGAIKSPCMWKGECIPGCEVESICQVIYSFRKVHKLEAITQRQMGVTNG
jgi:hypothetical protein